MDNDAKSPLIMILPVALVLTAVTSAWSLIVLAIAFTIAWRLWQKYYWQQVSGAVNPDFRRLIESHQGKITVADLAMETGLSGKAARWFLNRKAKEYGAQAIAYENRGIIYHFLTSGALKNMFDNSDPEFELEYKFELTGDLSPRIPEPPNAPRDITHLLKREESAIHGECSPLPETQNSLELTPIIQSDLAKRLKVHPSTIRKRRRTETFPAWSRDKDPQNVAWHYDPQSKIFRPEVLMSEVLMPEVP